MNLRLTLTAAVLVACGGPATHVADDSTAGAEAEADPEADALARLEEATALVLERGAGFDSRWAAAAGLAQHHERGEEPRLPDASVAQLASFMDEAFAAAGEGDDQAVAEGVIASELIGLAPTPERLDALVALRRDHRDRLPLHRVDERLASFGHPAFYALLREEVDAVGTVEDIEPGFAQLPLLAATGEEEDLRRIMRFASDDWPPEVHLAVAEALAVFPHDEGVRALWAMAYGPYAPHVLRAIGRGLLQQDRVFGVVAIATGCEGPEDAEWHRMEEAAGRRFASEDDVRMWVERAPSQSYRETLLADIIGRGFAVGTLESPGELALLLDAIDSGDWLERMVGWRLFVDAARHDPADGKFWTVVEEVEGGRTESAMALEVATPSHLEALRGSQARWVVAARRWLAGE